MVPTLRNYWHPVARAGDVTTKPVQVGLLDEQVVLFRAGSGIVALKDLCIHRGGWQHHVCLSRLAI